VQLPLETIMARPFALTLLLVFTLLAAHASHAHDPVPGHGCQEPTRPADDQDDARWQKFLDAVDGFRSCISAYAAANHAASDAHRTAANAATLDWNTFVRRELNVPEDYPWPPEPRR
jgi:hypothetical protein